MSFRSKLLLACLLSSSSTIVRALPTEESLSGNSWLPKNTPCGFRVGNYVHDLCPLFERRDFTLSTIQFDGSDPKTETYTFGPTTGDELSPCPENTFVCWNKPEASSSTAVATCFKLTAISQLNSFDDTPDPLVIELNGTIHSSKLQSMRIQFICDENVDQDLSKPLSLPSFLGRHDGVHSFSWKSRYACPREANFLTTTMLTSMLTMSATPVHTATATSAPKSDHNNEDEDNGDQSNLTDPVSPSDARRKAAIILLIIGLIIIVSLSLYHHPPRTLIDTYIRPSLDRISPHIHSLPVIHIPTLSSRTFTLANVKNLKLPSFKRSRRRHRDSHRPYRFRVGENKLVQWATEDSRLISEMGEGGEAYDFEEDFMVNGFDEEVDGAYLGEDVGAGAARGINGEYVPLSAGIRWGMTRGMRKNYGTAGTAA